MKRRAFLTGAVALVAAPAFAATRGFFDVRDFGARGDGITVDSPAINAAVKAANKAGGGTVVLTAGHYVSFSIRLLDHVTLLLAEGCVLEAADPGLHRGAYDLPESDLEQQFQDFGITQFHCSLIYADGAQDVAVIGRGMIHGVGLLREDAGAHWHGVAGWHPGWSRKEDPKDMAMNGQGIRAIGFKSCRSVLVRDVTILQGGHFACHLLGCTNVLVDSITVDTDRDGIDIDCCRDVRVRDCIVNAPKDDAIVVKSSYGLNAKIVCENISITGCKTSGYVMGSLLDGTYRVSDYRSVDDIGVLGRIKLGTESNGGFRNILIDACTCDNTRGILIGVVDGGVLEDVTVSNIILRNPVNHPLFVRQAARLRAPVGTTVGACRRARFSDIEVSGARMACGVQGISDGIISDVSFSGVHVAYAGGGSATDAAIVPVEKREASLEVSFMRALPAYGFYGRQATGLVLRDCSFTVDNPDARPAVVLDRVTHSEIDGLRSSSAVDGAVRQLACDDVSILAVRQAR